jgi:hypothetical protein
MNKYLAKLRALNSAKAPNSLTDKTDITHCDTGFVGFVGAPSSPVSENQPLPSPDSRDPGWADNSRVPTTYARAFEKLQRRCPDEVDEPRWHLALDDAGAFLVAWGEQAEALGWTAADLFGLHEVPANPHPTYQRLSRYDCTGVIWLLQGCPVVALTEATAAIKMPTGNITTYRRHNKPAYAPLGDSIDDFVA